LQMQAQALERASEGRAVRLKTRLAKWREMWN